MLPLLFIVGNANWECPKPKGEVPPYIDYRDASWVVNSREDVVFFGGMVQVGEKKQQINVTLYYESAANSWSVVEISGRAPEARVSAALLSIGESYLMFGGATIEGKPVESTLYRLTIKNNTGKLVGNWEELNTTGPRPVADDGFFRATASSSRVYVFKGDASEQLYELELETLKWTQRPVYGGGPYNIAILTTIPEKLLAIEAVPNRDFTFVYTLQLNESTLVWKQENTQGDEFEVGKYTSCDPTATQDYVVCTFSQSSSELVVGGLDASYALSLPSYTWKRHSITNQGCPPELDVDAGVYSTVALHWKGSSAKLLVFGANPTHALPVLSVLHTTFLT